MSPNLGSIFLGVRVSIGLTVKRRRAADPFLPVPGVCLEGVAKAGRRLLLMLSPLPPSPSFSVVELGGVTSGVGGVGRKEAREEELDIEGGGGGGIRTAAALCRR